MNPKQTTFIFFAAASALSSWIISFSAFQIFLFFALGIFWMFNLLKFVRKLEVSNFLIVLTAILGIFVGLSVFYTIWYLSQTPEVRNSDWLVGLMVGGLIFLFQTVSATFGIIGCSLISTFISKKFF